MTFQTIIEYKEMSGKESQTRKRTDKKNTSKDNIKADSLQEDIISNQNENDSNTIQTIPKIEEETPNSSDPNSLTPVEKKMIAQRLTALLNQMYQMGERLTSLEQVLERTEERVHIISSHIEAVSLGAQNAKSKKFVSK